MRPFDIIVVFVVVAATLLVWPAETRRAARQHRAVEICRAVAQGGYLPDLLDPAAPQTSLREAIAACPSIIKAE